jgi:hypothetical protein
MFCFVLGTTSAAEAANNESGYGVYRNQDSPPVAIPPKLCSAYNRSRPKSVPNWSTQHLFWSSDSSCGTHLQVSFLSHSSRWRMPFMVGEKYQSVLILLWHLQKDACQGISWERVPELWALSLTEARHDTITRRSWTIEATVLLSFWRGRTLEGTLQFRSDPFVSPSFQVEILDNESPFEFVHHCPLTSDP